MEKSKNIEKLLTAEEVAVILNIKLPRVYELSRDRQIPVVVLGLRQYRFSRQAIEKFITEGGTKEQQST